MFGAALVPLSQAVMLDIYPPARRGSAMAIWGMGVMLGPIMGPTLGGWLTDSYSWRWVFFVNLPFGILTTVGLSIFMSETPTRRDVPFSWFGFLSLSLGIGSLQMMLDRGEELGWFDSTEIVVEAILSIVGFYFFLADCFDVEAAVHHAAHLPRLELLDRAGLHVPDRHHPARHHGAGDAVHPEPARLSGAVERLSARHARHRHVRRDVPGRPAAAARSTPRILIFIGLVLATASLWLMVGWSLDVSAQTIAINSVAQGFGLGFVFVPLNTIAFATLPGELRTEGAALWTLIRNIGSSVGISIVIAAADQHDRPNITASSSSTSRRSTTRCTCRTPACCRAWACRTSRCSSGIVTQQAAAMAYSNDFLLMTLVSLSAFPLLALIRSPRAAPAPSREAARMR